MHCAVEDLLKKQGSLTRTRLKLLKVFLQPTRTKVLAGTIMLWSEYSGPRHYDATFAPGGGTAIYGLYRYVPL